MSGTASTKGPSRTNRCPGSGDRSVVFGSRQPVLIAGLEESRNAARRQEDDGRGLQLGLGQGHQPGHRLARVDGIEQQPFGTSSEADCAEAGASRGPIPVTDLIPRNSGLAGGRGQAAQFGHLDRQTADGGYWVDQRSPVSYTHLTLPT